MNDIRSGYQRRRALARLGKLSARRSEHHSFAAGSGLGEASGTLPFTRGEDAGSVVCQSRTVLASPPATTGSFSQGWRGGNYLRSGVAFLLGTALFALPGCSSGQDTPPVADTTQNAASSTEESAASQVPGQTQEAAKQAAAGAGDEAAKSQKPAGPEPSFEPSEPYKHSAVAYEAKSTLPGQVKRDGKDIAAKDKVTVHEKPSAGTGRYVDDLEVSVKLADQGKVLNEGPGYFTGAPYAVFTVTVTNNSDKEVDLSQVLITAVTSTGDMAQPLYGEIPAYDFTGSLAVDESSSTDYAFMPTPGTKSLDLHIDLDAVHEPMVFTEKLSK
ncbi:hypothetical protein [Glutamicibacter sp. HZAU]|uniref:hypothetical protein n=1 Tax=Glutamicibacter sp. HZAU TaxID=2049891 RepID=UPI001026A8A7|nr:hypothetical protein [Glutamicibacter sp. HZAU]RWZ83232.1 hypothetical protein EKH49_08570 [Glutamicibacter sp. HZAU]